VPLPLAIPRLLCCLAHLTLSLALVLPFGIPSAQAQTTGVTTTQVEAAYLYNFGKFVTWSQPTGSDSTAFAICVLGRNPFGRVLDATVAGESIAGKKITVNTIENVQQATGCKVLFVSASEVSRLDAIIPACQRMNILTVSDIPDFALRGGIIGLVQQEDRIRFKVNLRAAENSHLTLSSELLKVAVEVIDKPSK
jgi:hypothetical protein